MQRNSSLGAFSSVDLAILIGRTDIRVPASPTAAPVAGRAPLVLAQVALAPAARFARTRDHLAMNAPRLTGARVTLRPVEDADRPRLLAILGEPSVARWWGSETPNAAVDDLFEPYQTTVVIEVAGAVVGSIQVAEEEEPDYRHAGIDLFLDTVHQGQGLGPEAIALVARYLFEARGHHRLTIDPAAANLRAIRAYERVGFRPVGVMRKYERGHDGTWHDGLLMDLLVSELREPNRAGGTQEPKLAAELGEPGPADTRREPRPSG